MNAPLIVWHHDSDTDEEAAGELAQQPIALQSGATSSFDMDVVSTSEHIQLEYFITRADHLLEPDALENTLRRRPTINNLAYTTPQIEDRQFENNADGILAALKCCLYAESEADCNIAWEQLQTEFPDQPAIIEYFDRTYWPWRHQWAEFSVRNYHNLGIRSTARAEGSHRSLKRHLSSRMASLYTLHEVIRQTYGGVQVSYNHQISYQRRKAMPAHLQDPLFSNLVYNVSYKGLKLIEAQLQKARASPLLGECTKSFNRQFGLPCAHMLQDAALEERSLTLAEVDPHWHLHRDKVRVILSIIPLKNLS